MHPKANLYPVLPSPKYPQSLHNTRFNIYLVANQKALRLLDQDYGTHTLHDALSRRLGQELQPIKLNLNLTDPTHLDSSQAYKNP